MYVCNCHGFNEKAVRRAIRQGLSTVSTVYRGLGHTPQCGKCVPDIVRLLKEHRTADALGGPACDCGD